MIRVVVERRLSPERSDDVVRLLAEEERRARCADGCISVETLQSLSEPAIWVSTTTWTSTDRWTSWKASPPCDEIHRDIKSLLMAPERLSTFRCLR